MNDTSEPFKGTIGLAAWRREMTGIRPAEQRPLFNRRISTLLPGQPNGRHIGFRCIADDGQFYYCKDDQDGLPIRASEWICTGLAEHLGIATAARAIIENDLGQTFFGSRSPKSLADEAEVSRILSSPAKGELGDPHPWLGQYLARLRAYDLFVDNPDRSVRNFVLDRDGSFQRLCAIDFASARLLKLPVSQFPVASEATICVGNVLQKMHGPHWDSAREMIDRIAAVPWAVVDGILRELPEEWLPQDQRGLLNEYWSGDPFRARIAQLRKTLSDGS